MKNPFQTRTEPMVLVLYELVKQLESKITYRSIREKLLQHPAFPTLFSMTNTLTNFGITNKAVRLEREQLEQLETPFLASTYFDETLVVHSVENDSINYFSPSQGEKKSTVNDFIAIWNQMVVLVDTATKTEEKDYSKIKNFEGLRLFRWPIALSVLAVLLIGVTLSIGTTIILPYFLCKLLGLSVALLLVNKEINKHTKYGFCTIGSKLSCDDVLDSPAAKIFSWLSMTDLGFLYFTGTTLSLVLFTIVPDSTAVTIALLTILLGFLSLPYTIFSLIYQGFVLKKWCLLCLATIAILWIESLIGYFYLAKTSFVLNLERRGFVIFLFCLLIPMLIWMFIKNILLKSGNYDSLRFAHLRISNNWQVLQFVLQKQKEVPMDFLANEIVLGNESAKNVLVIAINPYCPACGREYDTVLKLLEKHPDFAQVIVRFVGSFHENDRVKLYTSAILTSQYLSNPSGFQELLKHWFETRDLQAFVTTHPVAHNKLSEKIVEHHFHWSEKAIITLTPTTYLNGKKISENYTLDQLTDMLAMAART